MATSTPNYGLSMPAVNSSTDQDLWGGELNTDLDEIDALLSTAINWETSPQTSTITVTAPTMGTTTTGSAKTLYLCSASGGAFAANLPAVATATDMVVAFKKTDSSANHITITGNSSDNIDGANTLVLSSQYAYAVIVCDGAKWNIISSNVSGGGGVGVTSVTFTGDGTVLSSTPSSAVTSTGTVTGTLVGVNANLVLAGPTSGGTNAPTYRSLISTDLPIATSSAIGAVKPDNSTVTISGGVISATSGLMTALGVGSIIHANNNTGGSVAAGGTISASHLTAYVGQLGSPYWFASGDSLSGTWQALQNMGSYSYFNIGLWQRTA